MHELNSKKYYPINKRSIIIPFKHFSQSTESLEGTERNFIGRTKQRAKLIHLLHNAGKRMALLVTGQRGSGKSTFVKYCLDDYSSHTSCRHLYNPSGNSTFELIHAALYLLAYWSIFIFSFEIVVFFKSTISNQNPDPTSILKSIIILLPFIGFMLHLITQHLKNIYSITLSYHKYLKHFSSKTQNSLETTKSTASPAFKKINQIVCISSNMNYCLNIISIIIIAVIYYLLIYKGVYDTYFKNIETNLLLVLFYIIFILISCLIISILTLKLTTLLTTILQILKSLVIIFITPTLLFILQRNNIEYKNDFIIFLKFLWQFSFLTSKSIVAIIFLIYLVYALLCNPGKSIGVIGVITITAIIISIAFIEYMLIICKNRDFTDEPTLNKEHYTENKINLKASHLARSLNEMTFFDQFVKYWKPSANISINLGFDDIDHRRIIRTMLESIKDKYYKIFIARGTNYYISSFLITLFFSMLIASSVTNYTINNIIDSSSAPNIQEHIINRNILINSQHIMINEEEKPSSSSKDSFNKELLFTTIPIVTDKESHELNLEFGPLNTAIISLFIPRSGLKNHNTNTFNNYYLNGLYILVIIFIYFLFYCFKKLLPNFSYNYHYKRITKLINHIDSCIVNSSKDTVNNSLPLVNMVKSRINNTTIKTEPLDTRIIENKFLEILKDIQYINRPYYTLPAPEITFVFDELDKLGSKYEIEERENEPKLRDTLPFQISKREVLIENLLSNLKNIISTAAARFIFIGGRELYDAWLADQTDINPLLTSIFSDGIIYIPNLLVDETDQETNQDCTDLINVYFYIQHKKSDALYKLIRDSNYKVCNRSNLKRNTYYHEPYNKRKIKDDLNKIPIREVVNKYIISPTINNDNDIESLKKNKDIFFEQFVKYLSYRSHGKPIKLKQLFSAFILPVANCIKKIEIETLKGENPYKDYDHIMNFRDIDIIVIQFINGIFNKLDNSFNSSISIRDDKVATSIFYLMDFLLKFHKRAFSWDSLEKVDALSDTYRDPDLRMILRHIVDSFSDLFLHKVINGMYSFRFRSDISSELRYISKFSSTEMAAFNFTLDESRTLKTLYINKLKQREYPSPSIVASLGELYDYDEEFDLARKEYFRAITIADEELVKRLTSIRAADSYIYIDTSEIYMLSDFEKLINHIPPSHFFSWAIFRLRLMLQVGLTFEQANNMERAKVAYEDAKLFSGKVIPISEKTTDGSDYFIRHITLLYQAGFSKAWAIEKIERDADSSTNIALSELKQMKKKIIYADNTTKKGGLKESKQNTSYHLIMSEMYNKSGDLYFFKGKTLSYRASTAGNKQCTGYIHKANEQYALCLHHLKTYLKLREESILTKKQENTFNQKDSLPSSTTRLLANGLLDIAESVLAKISLSFLFNEELTNNINEYNNENTISTLFFTYTKNNNSTGSTTIDKYLGIEKENKTGDKELTLKSSYNTGADGLSFYFTFSGYASSILGQSGNSERASRELIRAMATIAHTLWMQLIYNHKTTTINTDLAIQLITKINIIFNKIINNRDRNRHEHHETTNISRYYIGLVRTALSIALYLSMIKNDIPNHPYYTHYKNDFDTEINTFSELLKRLSQEEQSLDDNELAFSNITGDTIENYIKEKFLNKHRYPMLNRLKMLYFLNIYSLLKAINRAKVICDNFQQQEYDELLIKIDEIKLQIDEIHDTSVTYNAPMLFPYMQLGFIYYLADSLNSHIEKINILNSIDKDNGPPPIKNAKPLAIKYLRKSIESYTLQDQYYKNISNLYYLYDDFNDRTIHYIHALQMLGSDVAECLFYELNDPKPDK